MKIQIVPVEVILPLRQKILRPNQSEEESRFEGDSDSGSFHLALFKNNKVQGAATFLKANSDAVKENDPTLQYRLRGMAVARDMQGQGIGKKLFKAGEDYLMDRGVNLLWFNARASAVPFYEKLGCTCIGDSFELPAIGPHYLMIKRLN